MRTVCAEHGVSRKWFYELRKRAFVDGPAAVLEPRTRRPKASPSKLTDEVKHQAVGVRAWLEASGLDHGPISVHDNAHDGPGPGTLDPSLARTFRDADGDKVTVTDLDGELLIEHPDGHPVSRKIGNGKPRGIPARNSKPSPMS